jgi:hypothetical protein
MGECEAAVNEVCRELDLPVRARYAAAAQLLFHHITTEGKKRNEWLYFIPERNTVTDATPAVRARRR